MAFAEVSTGIISQFEAIVGSENVIIDPEKRYTYSHDETEDYSFLPDVVLKPGSAEEISKIMVLCNEHVIPVTPPSGSKRSCDLNGAV
jgi:glycolate oxidase